VIGPTIPGVEIIFSESDHARKLKRMREYDLPRLRANVSSKESTIDEIVHATLHLGMTYEALSSEFELESLERSEHLFSSLMFYNRCASILNYVLDNQGEVEKQSATKIEDDVIARMRVKAAFAYLLSLKVTREIGFLLEPAELFERAKFAVQMNSKSPEAHYFFAVCAASVDARQGLYLAEEGAEVARAAAAAIAEGDQTYYISNDSRMEWKCLHAAVECAIGLANSLDEKEGKRRTYARMARELAERAVAAGAPREVFAKVLDAEAAA
jgi:hypothetical protein